ncbi:MAG: topoisomerase DNA-binding C4 zinc finger domain-containing protein, partial [Desulfovibrionaceae bacterium]|nr:topoisomerase DNA-binding C4 zinc finger domain-containing protein [Desulfovibrionaceae bacterium]
MNANRTGSEKRADDAAGRAATDKARTSDLAPAQASEGQDAESAMASGRPPCPVCGRLMKRRKGAYGYFWGCPGYPGCRGILPFEEGIELAQSRMPAGAASMPQTGLPLAGDIPEPSLMTDVSAILAAWGPDLPARPADESVPPWNDDPDDPRSTENLRAAEGSAGSAPVLVCRRAEDMPGGDIGGSETNDGWVFESDAACAAAPSAGPPGHPGLPDGSAADPVAGPHAESLTETAAEAEFEAAADAPGTDAPAASAIAETEMPEFAESADGGRAEPSESALCDSAPAGAVSSDNGLSGQTPPAEMPAEDEPAVSVPCPRCGRPLVLRHGKRGAFWGCSGFPRCFFSAEDSDGRPVLDEGAKPAAKRPAGAGLRQVSLDADGADGAGMPPARGQWRSADRTEASGAGACGAPASSGNEAVAAPALSSKAPAEDVSE